MAAVQLLYQAALDCLTHAAGRVAVIHAHADPLLKTIKQQCRELHLLQHFKPEHDALSRLGLSCSQRLAGEYELILLTPAKNKQQTLGWMAQAMFHLVEGGELMVACANSHGAKSYDAALEKLAGHSNATSKSKCRIFSARKEHSFNQPLAEQWLLDAEPKRVDELGLVSQPGLFSWNRADIGSQLLLKHLPDSLAGNGMDLCCGYGFLAATMLDRHAEIETLHLVEADHLALDCAIHNTQAWHKKVQPRWLDAAVEPLPMKLDWIVCNPPFHDRHEQDIALGQNIIARACSSLKRGGRLYMVANRKLPYERTLDQRLMRHHTVVQADGFKVIEAVKEVNS